MRQKCHQKRITVPGFLAGLGILGVGVMKMMYGLDLEKVRENCTITQQPQNPNPMGRWKYGCSYAVSIRSTYLCKNGKSANATSGYVTQEIHSRLTDNRICPSILDGCYRIVSKHDCGNVEVTLEPDEFMSEPKNLGFAAIFAGVLGMVTVMCFFIISNDIYNRSSQESDLEPIIQTDVPRTEDEMEDLVASEQTKLAEPWYTCGCIRRR